MHLQTSVQLEVLGATPGSPLQAPLYCPPVTQPRTVIGEKLGPLGEGQGEGGNTSTLVLQIKPLCFDYFIPERGKSMLYPYRWLENQMLYPGHSS